MTGPISQFTISVPREDGGPDYPRENDGERGDRSLTQRDRDTKVKFRIYLDYSGEYTQGRCRYGSFSEPHERSILCRPMAQYSALVKWSITHSYRLCYPVDPLTHYEYSMPRPSNGDANAGACHHAGDPQP